MEFLKNLESRQSIRKFTEEPVAKEDIVKMTELAAMAPSWKNSQPTRFVAVTDKALLEKLANEGLGGFDWNRKIISGAPLLFVIETVAGKSGCKAEDGSFETPKGAHWQSFDAGLASMALCLAANELGYGSVIMGIFDEAEVKKLLGVGSDRSISALIAVGRPAEEPKKRPRLTVDELLEIK